MFLDASRSARLELSLSGAADPQDACLLAHSDRLSVKCTDPLAVIDIPHRLRETGDTLECREAARGLFFIFHVKRGKSWEQHFLRGGIFGVRCRLRCDNLR